MWTIERKTEGKNTKERTNGGMKCTQLYSDRFFWATNADNTINLQIKMRHSNLQSVPSAEKHVGQITIESPLSCDIFKTSYKKK